ncbi:hypothetical protein ILUMI_24624 [Ignelater luminosus]|uniref:Uncharacterized protein n=1 Tax=Ignelater luminosus TaxID=2038154 RepID=A0A8K0G0Q3_IGNLU|nr:hypothetical protein ILUMI_24624 [Ignelater luminosus]
MSVTGKAAEAIEGPSGDFYQESITTLTEQFGGSENLNLIAQYFKTIMNLELRCLLKLVRTKRPACSSKGSTKQNCAMLNVLLSKKKEVVKRNARCYRCTKRNRNSRDCRNKSMSCEKCKRQHVTTMCDPEWLKRS